MPVSLFEILPLTGVAAALAAMFYCQEQNEFSSYFKDSQQSRSLKSSLRQLKYFRVQTFRIPACGNVQLLRGTEAAFMRYYAFACGANAIKGERLIACAIRHPDGEVYAALRPGRHHHVIWFMDALGRAGIENTREQGFITSAGRFIRREAALHLAQLSGQIVKKHPSFKELYTEDMW
jgi:hypothetical protein